MHGIIMLHKTGQSDKFHTAFMGGFGFLFFFIWKLQIGVRERHQSRMETIGEEERNGSTQEDSQGDREKYII